MPNGVTVPLFHLSYRLRYFHIRKHIYRILLLCYAGISNQNLILLRRSFMEDIKAQYPVRNRVVNIVAYVFVFFAAISVGYSIYVLINKQSFEMYFIIEPVFISFYILKPFNFLSISYLVMWMLWKRLPDINQLHITKKATRILLLIFSLFVIAFYFFSILALSFGFITIPVLLHNLTIALSRASYIFAPVGVLLFFGLKS